MLTKKEFNALTLMERTGKSFSQRELSEALGVSLGTANKLSKELHDKQLCDGGHITDGGLAALEPYRVRRAVFIAAGFGSRLVPITFDQLLYKYPNIKFVENPVYNEANNISSAVCVRYLLKNAYVLEADLVLKNRALIRKYEYESNMLGIPVDRSDDWCLMTDGSGVITQETVGGLNCHQMVGISFWSEADGGKLAGDLDEVYRSPGGKERYWEQVPLVYKKENYSVHVRECSFEDITEIDTFNELKQIDKLYAT